MRSCVVPVFAIAARPAVIYWQPTTLAVLAEVRALREAGFAAWATMDAGPHVKVLTSIEEADQVAATLRGVRPDYADEERKAWKIPSLVGEAAPPGIVEASSPAGVSVRFLHPTPDGLEPVLFLTRRGEVIMAALDPKDPFPRYHGQGGRLRRAGDQLPRVAPVSKLDITRTRP